MSRRWCAASSGFGGYSGEDVGVNEERKIEVEEVGSVTPPPRARVGDAGGDASSFERKRDYLEGFLARQPAGPVEEAPGGSKPPVRPPDEPGSGLDLYEGVIEALKDIYDP